MANDSPPIPKLDDLDWELERRGHRFAVVEVLNAIYETDFLGFSYGFRPGAARIARWMRSRPGSTGGR